MSAAAADRFVVWSLRAMALGFAIVGILFIAAPDGVLETITDLGDEIGDFAPAPATEVKLWLGLGFSYMVVITGIALLAQTDVARYRPLLLVLAAGKAASSLSTLGFYLFDSDVFIYLLNAIVDGSLVVASLYLYQLAGRVPVRSSAPP